MAKVLRVTMPDGSEWSVPALRIAEERADYYACEVDGNEKGGPEWKGEVEHALADASDLMDYARNSMNWEDVAASACQVQPPRKVDYQMGWVNGKMELVDE